MLTDKQVRKLRQMIADGHQQQAAAAAAGMSERSARNWQHGVLPSETKAPRLWRTRPDPLEGVFDKIVVPLLERDTDRVLEAPTLLLELRKQHPVRFAGDAVLRTLQRRVEVWRALHGPGRSVIFPQEHPPGREAAFDFTDASDLNVTIAGMPLAHLLFVFVLPFSRWMWACVAISESFEALLKGLQGAFWALGGVTEVWRSDNLSAATHELPHSKGRTLTRLYKGLLDHYGNARSTRIKPGESHENGGAEKSNDLIVGWLRQALVIRGSNDFDTVAAYEAFVLSVIEVRRNDPRRDAIAEERPHLRALPSTPLPEWTEWDLRVTCWSTLNLRDRIYSVPSRLIEKRVKVRLYVDRVEVYYAQRLTATMPRLTGPRMHRICYRDIIWSLVRKPGAFARYRFREELFPTLLFRRAYDALVAQHGTRADVEYVRVLHLAASTLETDVEAALAALLESAAPFDYAAVRERVKPLRPAVPELSIGAPDFTSYDALITSEAS